MYEEEILMMSMYSGSMPGLDLNSIVYIEKVVRSHSLKLIYQSSIISKSVDKETIDVQDICFVLRKDKFLVSRIRDSFRIKQVKHNYDNELEGLKMDYEESGENIKPLVSQERLMILDSITKDMSNEDYLEYVKLRETSFTCKKVEKFKTLIDKPNLSNEVIEVIGLISKDLIFQIVQKSIRVRKEKYKTRIDNNPFRLGNDRSPLSLREVEEGTRRVYFKLLYRI